MQLPVRLETYGAAIAVASGLMLGGAMHPNLYADRPAGPQMIAGAAAMRAAGLPDSGMILASYDGRMPDYVMGTDAKKAMTWAPERIATATDSAAPEPRVEIDETPGEDLPTISRAAYEEMRLSRPHDYPSLRAAQPDEPDDDDGGPTISG